jgi:hypothetical protein
MKKVKVSLVAAALLANSALFAESTSLADALKNGVVSGEFSVYAQNAFQDPKDEGFALGSFNLGYSTDSFYGVKLSVGSRANHAFWESNASAYDSSVKAVLHTANLAYSHQYFDVVLGRQEINLNWASDFHEALVGVIKAVPDTAIVVGYTQRKAEVDYDAPLAGFGKLGEDGAFVVDAKWSGIEGLAVNPFVYFVPDVATWFGARADYDKTIGDFSLGGTAQYTQSIEDDKNKEDGSFLHLEARVAFAGLSAKLGFALTGKDGGVGSINAAGDNVNPFEDGEQLLKADATTIYFGASYNFSGFEVSGLYGLTDAGNDINEFDLLVGYNLNDALALQGGVVYVDKGDDDTTTAKLGAIYKF